jgi:hypothetical protein
MQGTVLLKRRNNIYELLIYLLAKSKLTNLPFLPFQPTCSKIKTSNRKIVTPDELEQEFHEQIIKMKTGYKTGVVQCV